MNTLATVRQVSLARGNNGPLIDAYALGILCGQVNSSLYALNTMIRFLGQAREEAECGRAMEALSVIRLALEEAEAIRSSLSFEGERQEAQAA